MKIIKRPEFLCSDSAYISVADYFGRRYEMMFSDLWNFEYVLGSDGISGENIVLRQSNEIELLKKYHGVNISICANNLSLNGVYEDLKYKKVIAFVINEEYLPWINNSSKNGFILVHKVEYNIFTCLDIHNIKVGYLSDKQMDVILENTCSYQTIEKGSLKNCVTVNPKEVLKSIIDDLYAVRNGHNTFDLMRIFSYEMLKEKNLLSFNNNIDSIVSKIREITRRRQVFYISLEYMYNLNNSVISTQVITYFNQCINLWIYISNISFKFSLTNNQSLIVKLAKLVESASILEEKIAGIISSCCN